MPCNRIKSISRVLYLKTDGNHSSRLFVTKKLKRPTRKRRRDFSRLLNGQFNKDVFLFGLAPRGVYPAEFVTKYAGALLPHRFTHHHNFPKWKSRLNPVYRQILIVAGLFSVALVVKSDFRRMPGS